ncbi:MAG: hypothetical protein ACT4PP_13725 [Sporichthyaceae bacterium]
MSDRTDDVMDDVGILDKVLAIHAALDHAGIQHAFGGALALAFHVEYPRATADIDVNITVEVEDASRVLDALPEGVGRSSSDCERIQRDGQVRLWWGRTPVDLFFPQHLLHQVVAGRVEVVALGETTIPVVSATDLTIFKALFDRAKDWLDISSMLAFGGPDVDEAIAWLSEIVGAEDARVIRLRHTTADEGSYSPSWNELIDRRRGDAAPP